MKQNKIKKIKKKNLEKKDKVIKMHMYVEKKNHYVI